MIARRLVIHGRVQGVGFRYAMLDAAAGFGVSGWVRNRRDGTVEARVQGEHAQVDAVIAWSWRGPPGARVSGVDVEETAPDACTGFELRPTL